MERRACFPWECFPQKLLQPFCGAQPIPCLLWLTETRPLVFVWTLSTSNQLVLVFDISWESHQEALIVLFSPSFFIKISITFSGSLPTLCLVCGVHPLPSAPAETHTEPSCRNMPDVPHLGQSELGSISVKLEKKTSAIGIFSPF